MTNTMKKLVLLFVGVILVVVMTKAQDVENELGFKYVKAQYLMETERYEDAIKAFTAIIKENSAYEDALLQRAKAKYAMAAYKGTKKDVLAYASTNGINEEVLMLLGKADYKLKNEDAALNSLLTATGPVLSDPQIYEFIGKIYKDKGQLLKACDFWATGADMGSSKCESLSRKVCGSTAPKRDTAEQTSSKKDSNKTGGLGKNRADDVLGKAKTDETKIDIKGNDDKENSKADEEEIEVIAKEEEPKKKEKKDGLPPEDDSPNDIEIDEELTITIYGNDLGNRKVLEVPNILILSEEIGDVAVDICINKRGKVESAELNEELSTIKRPSLVSLAIRKAKDFWFEKNDYKEQCGVMVFKKVATE